MRLLGVLLAFACGCDLVFRLEPIPPDVPPEHDEDSDGIDDAIDVCPHLASSDQSDRDDDHIGDLCDPHPDDGGDTFRFFAFAGTIDDLLSNGTVATEKDGIVFGDVDDDVQSLYVRDLVANDVAIELAYELFDPPDDTTFHEVAIVSVNRGDTADTRGDVCIGGYDDNPSFFEMSEDTSFLKFLPSTVPAFEQRAVLSMRRTRSSVACTLALPGVSTSDDLTPELQIDGRVGLWVTKARARLHYLWVYVHPPTPIGPQP